MQDIDVAKATKRHRRAAIALGLAGLCLVHPASAQVAPAFVGHWTASWQTNAKQYAAKFTVTESGGTWQTATQDRNNACAGREVPMKVESASPTDVQFTLQFSEVIKGCTNVRVELRLGPDGKVTGTRSKFELTLVRQP